VPATRKVPAPRTGGPNRRLFQPPLPLAGDPGPRPTTAPGAAAKADQSWRLDEKTRRAGRLGVAAARAALADSGRVGHDRRANAA
jgi:hypothetical protein